ncbi:MAG: peptidase [Cyanobacteria bacterium RYN_339]|nr:peptidase [Cyanobacteria bacterium RYN_339]
MRSTTYETIQEKVYNQTLPNGLQVVLVPKPDYAKTYAVFTTRYGSIDNHFQVEGEPEQHVTDGIAHFLEHKLFEEEWGDIFHTFAEQGASANAFTSHNRTAYLFSATDRVVENLETLLDFVQRPHLTPENVEKEKGIIEQEIRMYDDMPFWRGYRHLLEILFHRCPVRIDIAGTVESIYKIDRDALMTCYSTFYHPSNMVLAVVGPFDPEVVLAQVTANQAKKDFKPTRKIQRFFEVEPGTVREPRHTVSLAVSRPLVLMGYKDANAAQSGSQLRRELVMGLIQDVVFGRSSTLFQKLLDSGLIDDSFSFDYECGAGYGFSYLGTETDDPAGVEAAVGEALKRFVETGLDTEEFERSRRKQLGDYLHALNSPEAIANHLTDVLFKDADYFGIPDVIASITLDEANVLLREHYKPHQLAVSVVMPNTEAAVAA